MAFAFVFRFFLVQRSVHDVFEEEVLEPKAPWNDLPIEYQAKHCEHHGFQHVEIHIGLENEKSKINFTKLFWYSNFLAIVLCSGCQLIS